MGWAVGTDRDRPYRHIGYGVPALCDQPGCSVEIDRGLAYRCGDINSDAGCGLHFCEKHRRYAPVDSDGAFIPSTDADRHEYAQEHDTKFEWEEACARCYAGLPPFTAKPEHPEWVKWVLTDDSWAQFREEETGWVKHLKELQASRG